MLLQARSSLLPATTLPRRGAASFSSEACFRARAQTRGLRLTSRRAVALRRKNGVCYAQVGIFFSTSTGHTEDIAGLIKELWHRSHIQAVMRNSHSKHRMHLNTKKLQELGEQADTPADIGETELSKLPEFSGLVVGAPTWNTDADTERSGTNWDGLLEDIKGLDLKDKPVAVFGLGDSIGYGEYFCDAMEEIYSTFKATGAKMVGHWPTDGYDHEGSKALLDDGTFCGLALDEDNQDDLSADRIKSWVKQISSEMGN